MLIQNDIQRIRLVNNLRQLSITRELERALRKLPNNPRKIDKLHKLQRKLRVRISMRFWSWHTVRLANGRKRKALPEPKYFDEVTLYPYFKSRNTED